MHVFLDPALDVNRKIYKARAEEFIHIFVHQKAKLIEFLEHMVQVTRHFESVVFHGSALVADSHITLRTHEKKQPKHRAERVTQTHNIKQIQKKIIGRPDTENI